MSKGSVAVGSVWSSVLERFERHAPAGVMARLALEHALPAGWVDEVFEAHRQRQYARELLFSTVVELTTLVSLGLRPSLHAAARQMPSLPVSLASLYDNGSVKNLGRYAASWIAWWPNRPSSTAALT